MGLETAHVDSLLNVDYRAIGVKATNYWNEGNFEKSLEYSLRNWQMRRDNTDAMLYVAANYAKLNEPKLAGRFLLEAARLGYTDFQRLYQSIFSDVINLQEFTYYKEQIDEWIADQRRITGDVSYIEIPVKIRYRTILPNNFHPDIEYTILIMLHGYGGNLNNFKELTRSIQESNIIMITPQAPYTFEYNIAREPGYSWSIFDMEYEYYRDRSFALTSDYILQLKKEIETKYKVRNTFLAGFSQGGFTTLGVGIRNHETFDGLISFGAGLFENMLSEEEIVAGKSIPVLLVHGEQDMVVRYQASENAYRVLNEAGYNVTLHSFEGRHNIPRDEFERAMRWILNLSK
jgi:phospholipase/carboxylesterase